MTDFFSFPALPLSVMKMFDKSLPSKELLTNTNIPVQFVEVTYSDYDVRLGEKEVAKLLKEWKPSLKRPSLLLHGAPGLAKTMMACASLNEQHARYKTPVKASSETSLRMRQEKCPVYFIQLADLFHIQQRVFRLEGLFRRDPDNYAQDFIEADRLVQDLYHRVQFLVVDDVGKEHKTASEFMEDSFDFLVRTRHNHGLSTIFTTNIPVSRWSSKYRDSMESFIKRTCTTIEFR